MHPAIKALNEINSILDEYVHPWFLTLKNQLQKIVSNGINNGASYEIGKLAAKDAFKSGIKNTDIDLILNTISIEINAIKDLCIPLNSEILTSRLTGLGSLFFELSTKLNPNDRQNISQFPGEIDIDLNPAHPLFSNIQTQLNCLIQDAEIKGNEYSELKDSIKYMSNIMIEMAQQIPQVYNAITQPKESEHTHTVHNHTHYHRRLLRKRRFAKTPENNIHTLNETHEFVKECYDKLTTLEVLLTELSEKNGLQTPIKFEPITMYCSNCKTNFKTTGKNNFCPNCGAGK